MQVNRLFLSATYSFLLPGLGQIYQGLYAKGACFFIVFSALNFTESGRFYSPLVALAAALEAYWTEKNREAPEQKALVPISDEKGRVVLPWPPGKQVSLPEEFQGRNLRFSLVGICGAVLWIFSVYSAWLPLGDVLELQHRAERLAAAVRRYQTERGRLPERLDEIGAPVDRKDPWGSPFDLRPTRDGFELRSAGRDRQLGTEDDAVFRYH